MHPFHAEIHANLEIDRRRRDAEQRRLLGVSPSARRGLRRRPRPDAACRA
jgi:hypothetical protein